MSLLRAASPTTRPRASFFPPHRAAVHAPKPQPRGPCKSRLMPQQTPPPPRAHQCAPSQMSCHNSRVPSHPTALGQSHPRPKFRPELASEIPQKSHPISAQTHPQSPPHRQPANPQGLSLRTRDPPTRHPVLPDPLGS